VRGGEGRCSSPARAMRMALTSAALMRGFARIPCGMAARHLGQLVLLCCTHFVKQPRQKLCWQGTWRRVRGRALRRGAAPHRNRPVAQVKADRALQRVVDDGARVVHARRSLGGGGGGRPSSGTLRRRARVHELLASHSLLLSRQRCVALDGHDRAAHLLSRLLCRRQLGICLHLTGRQHEADRAGLCSIERAILPWTRGEQTKSRVPPPLIPPLPTSGMGLRAPLPPPSPCSPLRTSLALLRRSWPS